GRRAVVRRAKRPPRDKRMRRIEESGNRVDPCHLERFVLWQRRQDARQPTGEHRLPRPRWAAQEQVVASRRRKLERTARPLLPAYVGEIERRRRRGRSI